MINNYLFYLYSLPKEEQFKQIFIFIIFFFISMIICILLDHLHSKFSREKKEKHDS